MNYLLLDKNDITKVCEEITYKELIDELKCTKYQLRRFIFLGNIFRDKYIIVENSYKKDSRSYEKKLFYKSEKNGIEYYANEIGEIFEKKDSFKKIDGFIRCRDKLKVYCINCSGKEFCVKNIIARLFIEGYDDKKNHVNLIDNSNPKNVCVQNLKVMTNKDLTSKAIKTLSKKVGMYENGILVRQFDSTRQAGRYLYCSRSTVSDICNNKRKYKMYDLRWI